MFQIPVFHIKLLKGEMKSLGGKNASEVNPEKASKPTNRT